MKWNMKGVTAKCERGRETKIPILNRCVREIQIIQKTVQQSYRTWDKHIIFFSCSYTAIYSSNGDMFIYVCQHILEIIKNSNKRSKRLK